MTGSIYPKEANVGFCVKCKLVMANLSVRQKKFCTDCFLKSSGQKHFQNLTKMLSLCAPQNCIVAFSGGMCSRLMLDFLHNHLQTSFRKFHVVQVCFVDFGPLLAHDEEQVNLILNICSEYYETKRIKLDDEIKCYFKDLSKTAFEILLPILTTRILLKQAKTLGCDSVFLGDCIFQLSKRIIHSTLTASGIEAIPNTINSIQEISQINFLRPLFDFTIKEVAFLCHFRNLNTVYSPGPRFMFPAGLRKSPNLVLEDFLQKMETNQPGFQNIIFRTASKVERNEMTVFCKFCLSNNAKDDFCRRCLICVSELNQSSLGSLFLQDIMNIN